MSNRTATRYKAAAQAQENDANNLRWVLAEVETQRDAARLEVLSLKASLAEAAAAIEVMRAELVDARAAREWVAQETAHALAEDDVRALACSDMEEEAR